MSPQRVEFPQHTPTESGYDEPRMDLLIIEAQWLEAAANWPTIPNGQPTEDQFIRVDLPRLAGIARYTTHFPFSPANQDAVVCLREQLQRFGDFLAASDTRFRNSDELETSFQVFLHDDRNISLGMIEVARKETLRRYENLAAAHPQSEGIAVGGGVRGLEGVTRIIQRVEGNQFSYYELLALQDLAGLVESRNSSVRRIAVDLIDVWAENPGSMQKVYLFPMASLAAQEGATSQRLALIGRLAEILKTATYIKEDKGEGEGRLMLFKSIDNRMAIVSGTLALLRNSQVTPEIEGDLAGIIGKMLDPSTYPPEPSGVRDREGNILAQSSDIEGLILGFLGVFRSQAYVPESLQARLLNLAAEGSIKVNGAFIVLASLCLREIATGGTLAHYYGDPLFERSVRMALADLRFSVNNQNAVDAWLEHEVHDATRYGPRSRRQVRASQIGRGARTRGAVTRRSRVPGIARGTRAATRFRA